MEDRNHKTALQKSVGPHLLDYCSQKAQRENVQAVIDSDGDFAEAAKATGKATTNIYRSVRTARRKAAADGVAPECDTHNPTLEGLSTKRVSTLRDHRTGEKMLEWVISEKDKEAQMLALQEAIETMVEGIPKARPVKAPRIRSERESLMNVIPMGDPHFGMMAWAQECGESFDLDIARDDFCGAIEHLVKSAPPAEKCVLVNLGDFFHADNMAGVTAASGHHLDMDSRLPKMIDIGISAFRHGVETALKRHKEVHIICAQGNHDEVLSNAMSIMLAHIYSDEPRVTVDTSPAHRHYVEFGTVLIGVAHGHETKDPNLPMLMACDKPHAWARTKHRIFMRGHHHHDARKEYNGAIVEQFRTLSANDAYASHKGFLSGRDMKCLTFHSEYGEVSRVTCSIDLLRTPPKTSGEKEVLKAGTR